MEVLGEQALLGLEVRLEAAVEVEMVAGQVGEDRGAEAEAAHALLDEGVGRDLERRMGDALVDHLPEKPLQVEGFRGGERRAPSAARRCASPRSRGAP